MKASFLKKLITRYYRNKATAAERYVVERWYDSLDMDKVDPLWLKDREIKRAFEDKIMERMNLSKQSAWQRHSRFSIAASMLLIGSISIAIYLYSVRTPSEESGKLSYQVTYTNAGQLKHLILPDSTEVFLNANSILKIPKDFGKRSRHIGLLGEAFFKVKRDTMLPFTVSTSALAVRVLGTAFNVRSYDDVEQVQVAVNKGKVRVSDPERAIAELVAQEQLSYHRSTGTYELSKTILEENPSWVTGKVVLDRAGYDEMVQAFRNVYGLRLTSSDQEVLEGIYNLTLRHGRPAEQALEQLCTLTGKHYRKEDKQQIVLY